MLQLTPLMSSVQDLLAELQAYGMTLLRPTQFLQLGMLVGLGVVAQLLKMLLAPRLYDWLRAREGWPKWRLRMALLVLQRLRHDSSVPRCWVRGRSRLRAFRLLVYDLHGLTDPRQAAPPHVDLAVVLHVDLVVGLGLVGDFGRPRHY